jgi:hypothetical protein
MESYKETMKKISVFDLQELYDNEKSKEQSFSQWPFNTSVLDCNEKLKADIEKICNNMEFPFCEKEFRTSQLIEIIAQNWFALKWTPKFIDLDCSDKSRGLVKEFKETISHLPNANIFEIFLIYAHADVLKRESEKEKLNI